MVSEYFLFFQLMSPNLDVLQREDHIWCLDNVADMEGNLSVLDGDPIQEVVEAVTGQFKSCVLPKIRSFRKGNTDNKCIFFTFCILLVCYYTLFIVLLVLFSYF